MRYEEFEIKPKFNSINSAEPSLHTILVKYYTDGGLSNPEKYANDYIDSLVERTQ